MGISDTGDFMSDKTTPSGYTIEDRDKYTKRLKESNADAIDTGQFVEGEVEKFYQIHKDDQNMVGVGAGDFDAWKSEKTKKRKRKKGQTFRVNARDRKSIESMNYMFQGQDGEGYDFLISPAQLQKKIKLLQDILKQ